MAIIIGNLKPEDDGMHELGPEPNFNESMYFNFFDPARALGGFVRLGNRANEGRAEMTVCLFLPDEKVLFAFKRAETALPKDNLIRSYVEITKPAENPPATPEHPVGKPPG